MQGRMFAKTALPSKIKSGLEKLGRLSIST
jgi:hypothetical protein